MTGRFAVASSVVSPDAVVESAVPEDTDLDFPLGVPAGPESRHQRHDGGGPEISRPEAPVGERSRWHEELTEASPSAVTIGRLLLEAQREADRILAEARQEAERLVATSEQALLEARSRGRGLLTAMRTVIAVPVDDHDRRSGGSWSDIRAHLWSRLEGAADGALVFENPVKDREGEGSTSPPMVLERGAKVAVGDDRPMVMVTSLPALKADGHLGREAEAAPVERGRCGRRSVSVSRERWACYSTWGRNIGIVLVLFCLYQLWGTGVLEARSQDRLQAAFVSALSAPTSPQDVSGGVASPPLLLGEGSTVIDQTVPSTLVVDPAARTAPPGGAVALLRIPKIGVEKAVVDGTSVEALRMGPGRYRGAPLPGSPGNFAIAGHRTTYGAPFREIDELRQGDEIEVITLDGKFVYRVSEDPQVVTPDANGVLRDFGDTRLTLTTCHPEFRASERLIVVATAVKGPPADDGRRSTTESSPAGADAAPNNAPSQVEVPAATDARNLASDDASLSLGGRISALSPVVGWSAVLIGFTLALRRPRPGRRLLTYVVVAPAAVFVLLNLFENINRLLPAGV